MEPVRLGDLPTNGERRVVGRSRVLRHIAEFGTAQRAIFPLRQTYERALPVADAALDTRSTRLEAENGPGHHGLARARLANEADGFTRSDAERDVLEDAGRTDRQSETVD